MTKATKTKTTKMSAIARAEEQIKLLGTTVGEFDERRDDAEARLAELEDGAGDAVVRAALDGSDRVAEVAGQVAQARAEVETIDRALDAAREAKAQAERDVFAVRAAELREEAGKLHAQADERQRRTDALLGELEEHEGARYVPWEPDRPTPGVAGGGEMTWKIPQTQVLRNKACGLEHEAATLEYQAGVGPPPPSDALGGIAYAREIAESA